MHRPTITMMEITIPYSSLMSILLYVDGDGGARPAGEVGGPD